MLLAAAAALAVVVIATATATATEDPMYGWSEESRLVRPSQVEDSPFLPLVPRKFSDN